MTIRRKWPLRHGERGDARRPYCREEPGAGKPHAGSMSEKVGVCVNRPRLGYTANRLHI